MQQQQARYFFYILADRSGSRIQTGIASDLLQHINSFYNNEPVALPVSEELHLVYYEQHRSEALALQRERQLKSGNLSVIHDLIAYMNPHWLDLSDTLLA